MIYEKNSLESTEKIRENNIGNVVVRPLRFKLKTSKNMPCS